MLSRIRPSAAFLLLCWACTDAGGDDDDDDGGGSGDDGCSSHGSCDDLEFCYGGECEEIAGRRFFVSIDSADTATDGDWDAGGGAPDLFVELSMNNTVECRTSTVDDDFTPSWGTGCDMVFESGGRLGIDMYDEDLTSDDLVLTYTASGTDDLVELARARGTVLSTGSASLDITVTPEF